MSFHFLCCLLFALCSAVWSEYYSYFPFLHFSFFLAFSMLVFIHFTISFTLDGFSTQRFKHSKASSLFFL